MGIGRSEADWMKKELAVQTVAENNEVEYLYFCWLRRYIRRT